jgi:hypothetical protein
MMQKNGWRSVAFGLNQLLPAVRWRQGNIYEWSADTARDWMHGTERRPPGW